jgi:hypothetical protein
VSARQEIGDLTTSVLETLAFIMLYAPDFPQEDQTSTENEFSKLFDLLQSVSKLVKDADRRRWIDLVLQETQDALVAFTDGREDDAFRLLNSAQDHLRSYINDRKLTPSFLSNPDGGVEKL